MRAQVTRALSALVIEASTTYLGVPLSNAPSLFAEITTPDGLELQLPLVAAEPGRYTGRLEAPSPGLYPTRIRARGRSPRGHGFVRELTLTPFVPSGFGSGRECQPRCEPRRRADPRERPDLRRALRIYCKRAYRRLLDCLLR